MTPVNAAAVASTAGAVKDLRCATTAPRRVANDTRPVLDCVLVPAIILGLGAAAPTYETNPAILFPITHCPNNGGNLNPDAAELLRTLLSRLPDEHIEDLLPPEDADLTRGEGGQGLRILTLELLAEAETHASDTDGSSALADLARLQPLVPERLTAVVETAPPALAERARVALRILDPGGLEVTEAAADPGRVVPLTATSIELLRHPAARKGSMADFVMSLLAESEAPPEQGQLRAYSERITADALPSVSNAVSDTVIALGMPSVEIYRSRGERSIGIRSFDGTPSYIVVGDEHLNGGSPDAMDDAALRYALAAELAHIRFGHTRMTSNDVRRGVWGKSRAAAGFAAGLLLGPLVNKIDNIIPVTRLYSGVSSIVPLSVLKHITGETDGRSVIKHFHVSEAWVQAGIGKAGGALAGKVVQPEASDPLSAHYDQLLSTCRAMQLTADRVGLLMCGDLGAAIRAILASDETFRAEKDLADRHGIRLALARRNDQGQLVMQHLAIRIGALISFWLSDDYAQLREQLSGS